MQSIASSEVHEAFRILCLVGPDPFLVKSELDEMMREVRRGKSETEQGQSRCKDQYHVQVCSLGHELTKNRDCITNPEHPLVSVQIVLCSSFRGTSELENAIDRAELLLVSA